MSNLPVRTVTSLELIPPFFASMMQLLYIDGPIFELNGKIFQGYPFFVYLIGSYLDVGQVDTYGILTYTLEQRVDKPNVRFEGDDPIRNRRLEARGDTASNSINENFNGFRSYRESRTYLLYPILPISANLPSWLLSR